MKRFTSILYVVGDETLPEDLERAVVLAESHQARLTVAATLEEEEEVQSLPLPGLKLTFDALRAAMIGEKEQQLDLLAAPARARTPVSTRLLHGPRFLAVIREVLREKHDLVMQRASGGGYLGRLFSSDEMHLLRKCPCPVWLVKADAPARFRLVLAAVDVSRHYPERELCPRHELNLLILEQAISAALAGFAELHVVSVWHAVGESVMRSGFLNSSDEDIRSYLSAEEAQNRAALAALIDEATGISGRDALAWLKPVQHLPKGSPRTEIPALAERLQADLVVLGTVARTGIPGLFIGNTAENILGRVGCSVLALKPPGFVTPVTPGP